MKKFNWRLLLQLIISFIVIFALYQVGVRFYPVPVLVAYQIIAGSLIIIYFIINRGFSSSPPAEEEFPDEWDSERRELYISEWKARHKKAKVILIFFFPVVTTLLIDMFCLFVLKK